MPAEPKRANSAWEEESEPRVSSARRLRGEVRRVRAVARAAIRMTITATVTAMAAVSARRGKSTFTTETAATSRTG